MGWTDIEQDYPVSIKEVVDITAETGALTTQSRVMELKPYGTGKHMTNADMVRSKSDRELAWLLFAYAHKWRRISFNQIYKWLQEETK